MNPQSSIPSPGMERRSAAKSSRRDSVILIVLAMLSYGGFLVAGLARNGNIDGFPLDDAWIHQVYGRSLASTGRPEYIPGQVSAGSTAPAYSALLSVGYRVGLDYRVWTHTLGLLALIGMTLGGAWIAALAFPNFSNLRLWTGSITAVSWHLVWASASGMETGLFCAAITLICGMTCARAQASRTKITVTSELRNGLIFGAVCGFAIALRIEGALLLALCGTVLLIDILYKKHWPLWWFVSAGIGFIALIAPFALSNLSITGSVLPNTAAAKQTEYAALLARGFFANGITMITPLLVSSVIIVLPFAIYALYRALYGTVRHPERRRERSAFRLPVVLALTWATGLIVLYVVRLPVNYQHGRYVIPALMPLIAVGTGAVLHFTARRLESYGQGGGQVRYVRGRLSTTAIGARALLAGLTTALYVQGALAYSIDVQLINQDMVITAKWVNANIDPGQIPAQLIAAHDIGALGYFASRPLLDLAALVTPETLPYLNDPRGMWALIQARGVRYLVLLPYQVDVGWLPYLCERFNAGGDMGGMRVYEVCR